MAIKIITLATFAVLLTCIMACKRNSPKPETSRKNEYYSMNLIKDKLEFQTTAFGRESKLGNRDYIRIPLFNSGYTHPSVIFVPGGIGGYNYWCAITPFFGAIAKQSDFTAFENPHVFRSKDGINWSEPGADVNPIDVAYPGPLISYWSDTHLQVDDEGNLHLYYRGNGFPKGFYGDKKENYRAVVHRVSKDGIKWSSRKLIYSTNTKGVDENSAIVSPAIVKDGDDWYCYDVQLTTAKHPIPEQGNQSMGFVVRRSDTKPDGSFGDYSQDEICQFNSRPWGNNNDPWHIDACKYKDTYYLLICAGLKGKSNGESLYLAYSKDGKRFDVVPEPLFTSGTYRSSILPVSDSKDKVTFRIYQSDKAQGEINLYELVLNKKKNGID